MHWYVKLGSLLGTLETMLLEEMVHMKAGVVIAVK